MHQRYFFFLLSVMAVKCIDIPYAWIEYLEEQVKSHQCTSICPPPNPLMMPSEMSTVEAYLLPHTLIWNPLFQFPTFFKEGVQCPKPECKRYIQFSRWNVGRSSSHGPRLLHELSHMVLLLPAVYVCSNGHELLSTDPYILQQFSEQEYIPFILFHRSGVTREFARVVISLCIEGLSFGAIEHLVKSRRTEYIASLQLQAQCIPPVHFRTTSLLTCASIIYLYQPYPSNDLFAKCFQHNFAENRNIYTHEMASLSTSGFISIDHTFKITANLGYLRPDGNWVSLYNSLFIVLNNIGQVIAWQFTRTTSINETSELLSSMFKRFQKSASNCEAIYVDNCCTVRNKLQQLYGSNISVKLDIFHAVQRITRVLPKQHLLYSHILKDVKLLFRDPKDTGQVRTLPTPTSDVLLNQLDMFITKWREAEVGGSYILNSKVQKELLALKSHISKGCLSNIPPQAGTNRNENLHRFVNPYFRRCRMGIPLALALLTILFHRHNQKHTDSGCILSARASYIQGDTDTNQDIRFGIMNKTELPSTNSWIFAKKGDLHRFTEIMSEKQMTSTQISPDIDSENLSIQDLYDTLQSAFHLYQLTKSLHKLSNHSPLLHQTMLPFMSSVSCLFLTSDRAKSYDDEHQQRLRNIVQSWGFQMHHIEGDGNCCFTALAFTLCAQKQEIQSVLPNLFSDVGIHIEAETKDIAYQLRLLAVNEWVQHAEDYQSFLDGDHTVSEEAPQFLQQGHFYGPLGNTMVLAVSNALGLPIIVFSSANHYPVINISPRVCRASIPLYIAFNQSGAGHYDAVFFKNGPSNMYTCSTRDSNPDLKCTCGRGSKHYSTMQHCGVKEHKYTTSIRCPCHLASRQCISLCQCSNCANPHGIKPRFTHNKMRERRKHAWNQQPNKSALYARLEQEKVIMGPRTQLEYLLVCEILSLLRKKQMHRDLHVVHKIYTACFELCQGADVSVPLSEKTIEEISDIIGEYDKHRKVFESICIAQLKINYDQ